MTESTARLQLVYETKGFKKADEGLKKVAKSTDKADKETKQFQKTLKGYKPVLGGLRSLFAGVSIALGVGKIIAVTAEYEDLQDALDAVTGSAKAGREAFQFISDFAQSTPFDVQTLTKAFTQLKAAGIQPTTELLTTFSDAASVTTDKIGVFEALVRTTARSVGGGLGLEELNPVLDRVPGLLQGMTEELGTTRLGLGELGKTAEGATKVIAAMQKVINQKFGGATEKTMDNLSTAISNAGISFDLFIKELSSGAGIADLLTSTFTGVGKAFDFLRENIVAVSFAIKSLAWAALIGTGLKLLSMVKSLTIGFGLLNVVIRANPLLLLVSAVGAAIAAFKQFVEVQDFVFVAMNAFMVVVDKIIADFGFLGNAIKAVMSSTYSFNDAIDEHSAAIAKADKKQQDFQDTLIKFRAQEAAAEKATNNLADATGNLSDEQTKLNDNPLKIAGNQKSLLDQEVAIGELLIAMDDATRVTDKYNDSLITNKDGLIKATAIRDTFNQLLSAGVTLDNEQTKELLAGNIALAQRNATIDSTLEGLNKMNNIMKSTEQLLINERVARGDSVQQLEQWKTETLNSVKLTGDAYKEFIANVESIYTERLPAAQLKALDESRKFSDGVKKGFNDINDEASDFGNIGEQAFTTSVDQMGDAFGSFVTGAKLDFKGLTASLLSDLAKIAARQALVGAITGAFGGIFNNAPVVGTPAVTASAQGNAFSGGNVIPFAKGGILTSATGFNMENGLGVAGEAGPEGVLPLKRDSSGNLGVISSGSGGGGGNVVSINVNNNITVEAGASGKDGQPDPDLGKQIASSIDGTVRDIIKDEIGNQGRPGNSMNRTPLQLGGRG